LKADEVGLDNYLGGWLRGYSDSILTRATSRSSAVRKNHLEGIMVGPRYNFVQPNWKIVPFISGGVGFLFCGFKSPAGWLGRDFNFSFEVSTGFKYLITVTGLPVWRVEYTRTVSNAGNVGAGEPNNAIDALGPQLTFGYTFLGFFWVLVPNSIWERDC